MTRPFVSRQRELELLTAAFDRASASQGSVLAVLGEPGIGKSTLCERAADYASSRGGRVLTDRCYEQSQLSVPYLPFIEALLVYVDQQDAGPLASELGSGAAYVARVMPRMAARMRIQPAERSGDAKSDRGLEKVDEFENGAAATAARCNLVLLRNTGECLADGVSRASRPRFNTPH